MTNELVRRVAGFTCLGLAGFGALVPIIPGWPAFALAIVLLGRRDPLLRRSHLVVRRILRRMRRAHHPLIRRAGVRLTAWHRVARHVITPLLIWAEQRLGLAPARPVVQ